MDERRPTRTASPTRAQALAALAAVALIPRGARAQTLTPIVVAGVPEDSITPVLVGIRLGTFRKYGLDVKVESQRSGPAVTSAVLGGAYQIGKASVPPLILAHAKNAPLTIVAPAGIANASAPIDGMFVRVDSPYRKATDLNGKTFGVYGIGDIYTIANRVWMQRNGGDASSVKLVEFPISTMVAAIETGRVDAATMNEPALQVALASPKLRLLAHPFAEIAPRFLYTAWFASTSYVNDNPAVIAAFQKGLREAATFCNAHHEQTADDIAQFTSIDPATIRKMARVDQGTDLDPRLVQPVIDAMAAFKDIAAPFDARTLLAH
jgi:NitT/TauT family transport system substrate-binding protein